MAATASSVLISPPPPLPESEGLDSPGWVILDIAGYTAKCRNATFAKNFTRTGQLIEVTFCTARPPAVSYYCVHCPNLHPADFRSKPKVISTEADLILFRVCVDRSAGLDLRYCDYFLYKAHPQHPSLDLLPQPYPCLFGDNEVALLRCGDEYAIAALRTRPCKLNQPEFSLYLYQSSRASQGWTSKIVSVAKPLRDKVCPVEGAVYHETTKAITLGGPSGKVGWVDLWRGILVCAVLDENPVLHDIPLPLPARVNRALYCCCPPSITRDITVSQCKDYIKYIETDIISDCWQATKWYMPISIASWENWKLDCTISVADIAVDPMHYVLLPRLRSSDNKPTEATLLPSLIMAFPIISMDDDAVYLLSKACPKDNMEVMIAIDMKKKKLQGVAKLDTAKDFTFKLNCTSQITNYLNKARGRRKALKEA